MSLADDICGEPIEELAVLYCDLSPADSAPGGGQEEREMALWGVNYFRTARQIAADHKGREVAGPADGWTATFDSTVEALVCARELSTLFGWQTTGPSLSGGLSAGAVIRDPYGVRGSAVTEAIALCRRAEPRQVLVANPLRVVVERASARSFASVRATTPPPPSWWPLAGPESQPPVGPERPLRLLRDPTREGVRLTVLGWVQLEAGASPTRRTVLRGSQARAILSKLALQRGPVHKDELGELLWPTKLPDHWEGALRGLITKIRRFFDAGGLPGRITLLGEDGYYELCLPAGVTVDRHEAAALIGQAEAALAEHHPGAAVALAGQAAVILERRLLSGPDNSWFDQVRAELAHDRLAALELCARAELDTGGLEAAKRATLEALALDPYRESSYRLLMQAQAAAGSRGEALRTYERCRRRLADDLGVGPSAQTQELYIDLLG